MREDMTFDSAVQEEIFDLLAPRLGVVGLTSDAEVSPGNIATYEAAAEMYTDPGLREALVADALSDEPRLREVLETYGFNEGGIEQIVSDLAAGSETVSVETFFSLPQVVDFVVDLEDSLADLG